MIWLFMGILDIISAILALICTIKNGDLIWLIILVITVTSAVRDINKYINRDQGEK